MPNVEVFFFVTYITAACTISKYTNFFFSNIVHVISVANVYFMLRTHACKPDWEMLQDFRCEKNIRFSIRMLNRQCYTF